MLTFEITFPISMRLRTSKALKLFAILLFSFEMIAPALVSVSCDPSARRDSRETFLVDANHLPSLISSLLMEENSGEEEEERESKDHRASTYYTDLVFVQAFELIISDTRQTAWVEPHETTATQPKLFALLHQYLI
jgi:hypothetical protein